MFLKSDKEYDVILTYDFLYKEYVINYKSTNRIAKELRCGIKRVTEKIREYKIKRIRKAHNFKTSNIDKIKDAGFEVITEYKGIYHKICVKCKCGTEFYTIAKHLITGHTKSCGCLLKNIRNHNWTGYEDLSGHEFSRYIRGAKSRNLEFNIKKEDIWNLYIKQNKKCALSNIDLIWDNKNGPGNASIDRIDNTKGYIIDNIQIILKDLNMMKRHHTQDYFIELCKLVSKNAK